jgi:hypothetical protein
MCLCSVEVTFRMSTASSTRDPSAERFPRVPGISHFEEKTALFLDVKILVRSRACILVLGGGPL